jgi:hypothetical protein
VRFITENLFPPPLKGCQHDIANKHHIASPLQRGTWAWFIDIERYTAGMEWQEK